MNERQKRFVKAYLIDLNATKAAIAAGYSKKTAGSLGGRLLQNAEIKRAILKGQEKRLAKYEITSDRVLQELAKLAYSNMEDYTRVVDGKLVLDTSNLSRDQLAAVQEVTEDATGGSGDGERRLVVRTRFKLADKGLNLERLGRHLKLFTDTVEHKADESLAALIGGFRKRLTDGNGDSK